MNFISGIDYMPTILAATGLKAPQGMDGRSFLPLLNGEKQDGRDNVFTCYNDNSGARHYPMRCLQTKRFGYIYNAWSDGKYLYKTEPMGGLTLQIPFLDVTTVQSAGVSPFFGGVQMYWTAEAQTRTEPEPQFKQMELKAWELSGYSVSSNILLQDSAVGLEKFLMNLFAQAIAWYEEYAFLQGNGAGKPQGMLGCSAAIPVTRQGAGLVQFQDVATMWSKLLPISWGKAFWTFSPSVVPQLLQLKDGANRAIPGSGPAERPATRRRPGGHGWLVLADVRIPHLPPALQLRDLRLRDVGARFDWRRRVTRRKSLPQPVRLGAVGRKRVTELEGQPGDRDR